MTEYGRLIEGVEITPLKTFVDDRGVVMRMMRNDDPTFERFGEIYFSTVRNNAVKAWHLHRRMTLNYAVVYGEIELVLFDERPISKTYKMVNVLRLDGFPFFKHYVRVRIPPLVWNGFRSISGGDSIVANCSTEPPSPDEMVRITPKDFPLYYNWGDYNFAW
jgi:dTDP-4-dehydrorhamnose 3,5-epimerase